MSFVNEISAEPTPAVGLPLSGVDVLMPMAMLVAPTGTILHAGPTLAKLRPDRPLAGEHFMEVFEVRRPRHVSRFRDLAQMGGGAVQIRFRAAPQTTLKGIGVVLPADGGMLVNLSFGIGAVDAPGIHGLSNADFAPTDLTIELLYLVEANAAVQSELRRLNQRLHRARDAAEVSAQTDALTGLYNRRALDLALGRYAAGADPFGVMQVDLDYFKQVNDELGHDAGDAVLRKVATIMREVTRERDIIARPGGDEFVLIMDGTGDQQLLAGVATRLLARLQDPIRHEGGVARISASIGIALSRNFSVRDPAAMLRAADAALYVAKNAGRGQFAFANPADPSPPEPGP